MKGILTVVGLRKDYSDVLFTVTKLPGNIFDRVPFFSLIKDLDSVTMLEKESFSGIFLAILQNYSA